MGKVLRREHITFFTARMDEHNLVSGWEPIANKDEYLFRIKRRLTGTDDDVIVHLTDAYRYGLAEFFARPDQLRAGSFIVLGMPHADAALDVIELAKKHRIGVGHIGKFMGALNYNKIWEYMTAEERRREQEAQGRKKSARNVYP